MKQKNNPFVSIIALLVLAVLLLLLVGCSETAEGAEENRFTFERDYHDSGNEIFIITDTETDEQYLYVDGHQAGAMVQLEQPVVEGRKAP